jgi:hypothetical protein
MAPCNCLRTTDNTTGGQGRGVAPSRVSRLPATKPHQRTPCVKGPVAHRRRASLGRGEQAGHRSGRRTGARPSPSEPVHKGARRLQGRCAAGPIVG